MKEPSKNKSADTDWEIDIQSCSATDCTGLIPALPESDGRDRKPDAGPESDPGAPGK